MGFAINPSLNYLQINESHILEFYRSTAEVALPDARFRGHPFEAYICITRVEAEMRAYVALLNTSLQSVLVYSSDFVARKAGDYPQVAAEAEAFVSSMGFSMEKVNLDFSPAMREVILKGFRVMRPLPPSKKHVYRQPRVDVPVGLGKELDLQSDKDTIQDELTETFTELQALRTELVSARAALAQITREKVSLEQRLSLELAALQSACEQAVEAKRLTEERLELLERSGIEQARDGKIGKEADIAKNLRESVKQLQANEEEISSLKKQLATAKEAADFMEKQLRQELTATMNKVDLLLGEKALLDQRLASESALSRELLAKADADKVAVESRLAAEKDANLSAAARIEALSLAEQSWKEGRHQTEELSRSLATVAGELTAAKAELATLRQGKQRQEELLQQLTVIEEELVVARADLKKQGLEEQSTAELLLNLSTVKEELAVAKTELAQLRDSSIARAEMKAEISQTIKEKEAVEAEYVRLATVSREKEIELADSLALAEAENERLARELEIKGQVAAVEQASLRAELHRLIVAGNAPLPASFGKTEQPYVAEGSPASAPVQVQQPELAPVVTSSIPPEAIRQPTAPAAELLAVSAPEEETDDDSELVITDNSVMKEFTNEFGGFYVGGETSATEFRVDPSIDCIEYHNPGEIVVVFHSSNTVQAVPDGSTIQRCRGYVIALKQSGSYSVYVAWQLTESGKVVVCLPDQQPVDSDSCVQILRDAIAYFEIVGFMMDIADLGTTVKSYSKALKKIPVFCSAARS